jgi:hypothetical protein
LANPGQHPVHLPKDQRGPLNAIGGPACGGFEFREHFIEAIAQIFEHVIAIRAEAVSSMECRRRPTDEHGIRDEVLDVPLGG